MSQLLVSGPRSTKKWCRSPPDCIKKNKFRFYLFYTVWRVFILKSNVLKWLVVVLFRLHIIPYSIPRIPRHIECSCPAQYIIVPARLNKHPKLFCNRRGIVGGYSKYRMSKITMATLFSENNKITRDNVPFVVYYLHFHRLVRHGAKSYLDFPWPHEMTVSVSC